MRRNPPRPSSDSCRCGSPSVRAIQERITAGISRRTFLGGAAAMLATPLLGGWPGRAWAQQPGAPERPILLTNLRLFDGTSPTVRRGVQILVEGNRIHALPAAGRAGGGAAVIGCGG